jgi:hypothetical protein
VAPAGQQIYRMVKKSTKLQHGQKVVDVAQLSA